MALLIRSQGGAFGLILLLYGAGLGAAAQMGKIAATFPALREIYPASDATQGFLLSIISLVGVALGVVAGQLVASQGYKRMLVFALGLGAAMSLVQAGFPRIELFLASRVLEGCSHLAIVVAAPTLMAQITPERHRYLAMTLWSSFFGVTFGFLALIAPLLLPLLSLGGFYVLHAAYMLGFAVILQRSLPAIGPAGGSLPRLREVIERHILAYRSPLMAPAALGWLCYTLTFVSILAVLPPFLPEAQRTTLATVLPIGSVLISFTFGALLMRRFTAVSVVQIGFLTAAIAALWMSLMGVSAAPLLLLFAGMGLVQPASFAVVPELNKTAEDQALANGAMAQMGNLGNGLGTPLLLSLIAVAGVDAFPIALVGLYGLGIAVHAYTQRLRRRAS